MGLPLTSGQAEAVARADSAGVVYVLEGTLSGVSGLVSDYAFRFATQPFRVSGLDFEPFMGPPSEITRTLGRWPMEGAADEPALLPLRNLPFGDTPNLLSTVVDNEYRWENSSATLKVFYLPDASTPISGVYPEATVLISSGILGAPRDITHDGFTLPLFPRSAMMRHNQRFTITVAEAYNGLRWIPEDGSKTLPFVIGRPSSWLPAYRLSNRIAYTTSAYEAGATSIRCRDPFVGPQGTGSTSTTGLWAEGTGSFPVAVHRIAPAYTVQVTAVSGDGTFTLTLSSGLAYDVPKGAPVSHTSTVMDFAISHFGVAPSANDHRPHLDLAWRLSDGRIVPETRRFRIDSAGNMVRLWAVDNVSGFAPFFIDDSAPEDRGVTTQPEFQSTSPQTLSDKAVYPTGGAGMNNANARDGNENTYAALGNGDQIALTFPDPPSPFMVGDTTESTLYVIAAGELLFGPAGIYGTTPGGPVGQFRFAQDHPRDYDQTVLITGTGFGGTVHEVWWVHTLETSGQITRTQDVKVGYVASGSPPPIMRDAMLVWRPLRVSGNAIIESAPAAYRVTDPEEAGSRIPLPSTVMLGMLLQVGLEGRYNAAAYAAAHARYLADPVRIDFAYTEPTDFATFERDLAMQSRSFAHYGPLGHELIYVESPDGYDQVTPEQEFRLPGVPGANVISTSGPLMERLPLAEIVNHVRAEYDLDNLARHFQQVTEASNVLSVVQYGTREPGGSPFPFYMKSSQPSHPSYSAAEDARRCLTAYLALNQDGGMRFEFDTAWIAAGLDRGSIVRVAFTLGGGIYRNAACLVERITVRPVGAERYSLSCRQVGPIHRGIRPLNLWVDGFATGDTWTDLFTGRRDRWRHYFGV